jgi:redox-sensing transcriptional repressor
MENKKKIAIPVIKRLPRYYRYLDMLEKDHVEKISSREMAKLMGLTASQIRQDLNYFGGFGQQGYGYNVQFLKKEIAEILDLKDKSPAILIGFGHLGNALARNMNFSRCGFDLVGIFDVDPAVIGTQVGSLQVRSVAELEEFCRACQPAVAVLTIPRSATIPMAKDLVRYGVKAFWNFSNGELRPESPDVLVENMHLGDSLMTLSYFTARNDTQ